MAQNDYRAPNFGVQDTRQVTGQGISGPGQSAGADVTVGEDWRGRLLSNLGDGLQKVGQAYYEFSSTKSYLEGQAAAAVGKSVTELQSDPITRDWAEKGFHDAAGKMAVAQQVAKFPGDLKKLREKAPEEFQSYLTKRRDDLTGAVASMSLGDQAKTAAQLQLMDIDDTAKYTTERAKFIIETKSQAINTKANAQLQSLAANQVAAGTDQGRTEDYLRSVQTTAAGLYADVWSDSSLPASAKQELTKQIAQQALSVDQVAMYDYMNHQELNFPDGTKGTLISKLPAEDQIKLSASYREAMSRTADMRNLVRSEEMALLETQIDQGQIPGSYEMVRGRLDSLVQNGSITGSRREGILQKMNKKQLEIQTDGEVASAVLRGDNQYMMAKNKTPEQAMEALDRTMVKQGLSPSQMLGQYMQVGRNGNAAGYKKAGSMMGSAITQLADSEDNEVLPQNKEIFRQFMDVVNADTISGKTNSRESVMSGLNERDRMFTEKMLNNAKTLGFDGALQLARKQRADDMSMAPSAKAAKAANLKEDIQKSVAAVDTSGWVKRFWTGTKAFFGSEDAIADQKLAINQSGVIGNTQGEAFYVRQTQEALLAESNFVATDNPSASGSEVVSVAKANLAARTIPTTQGPLILPRGADVSTVFGVPMNSQAKIGPAIDKILGSSPEGGSFHLVFQQGRLFAQGFDKEGQRSGSGFYLEKKDIQTAVNELNIAEDDEANKIHGAGTSVTANGVTLSFSGSNTAGVPEATAFKVRNNLVAHEGLTSEAYKDLSGKIGKDGNPIMTVGPGISSHNPHYPKLTGNASEDSKSINSAFIKASDDALKAGGFIAQQVGKYNDSGIQLMSELAYQSGVNFAELSSYKVFLKAMQSGNAEQAKAVFLDTPAFKASGNNPDKLSKRQSSYLSLIEGAMKGN